MPYRMLMALELSEAWRRKATPPPAPLFVRQQGSYLTYFNTARPPSSSPCSLTGRYLETVS